MSHKTEPPIAHTLQELGMALGELRYDAVAQVLISFADSYEQQAIEDALAGRIQLGAYGSEAAILLHQVISCIERMLKISIPRMREELAETPLIGHHE